MKKNQDLSFPKKINQKILPDTKADLDFAVNLYTKYVSDLKQVREKMKKLYSTKNVHAQQGDIEIELAYLYIREFKPKIIVEMSPNFGWSTLWLLSAIKDNGFGKLYSYDLVDYAKKNVPLSLGQNRWIFIQGDIKKNLHKLPQEIDYLFVDAAHSSEFAYWYIKNIFPNLRIGAHISVHDVFKPDPQGRLGEGRVVVNWLRQNNIRYFSPSPSNNSEIYDNIVRVKDTLGINQLIHRATFNSTVFFTL